MAPARHADPGCGVSVDRHDDVDPEQNPGLGERSRSGPEPEGTGRREAAQRERKRNQGDPAEQDSGFEAEVSGPERERSHQAERESQGGKSAQAAT